MGSNLKPEPITVVVDTREQMPYSFERMIVGTLHTGDYSVQGLEDEVAIERKSLIDAYGSIGQGRERFEREIVRLSEMKYAAIVIESNLKEFLTPPAHSSLNPKSAIGSLLSWMVKYKVPVIWCGDRAHAQSVTLKLLEFYAKYRDEFYGTSSA